MDAQGDTPNAPRSRIPLLTSCHPLGLVFRFVEQSISERTAGTVRAEMARRKISGRKLGEAMGWSLGTTHRRLNGQTPITVDELHRIADFLDLPPVVLLTEQDAA